MHSKDLEAIVTLLEAAALSLTTEPDATFSYEELVGEARKLGGIEIERRRHRPGKGEFPEEGSGPAVSINVAGTNAKSSASIGS